MKARRLLAVLVLAGGPVWFALAAPAAWRSEVRGQKSEAKGQKDESAKPAAGQKPSLAEIAPRPRPVPPPDPAALEGAIRRGVAFLVGNQNKDGSWGSPALKGGVPIYTPVPGGFQAYQCAVTALCISALIDRKSTRLNSSH